MGSIGALVQGRAEVLEGEWKGGGLIAQRPDPLEAVCGHEEILGGRILDLEGEEYVEDNQRIAL